jgi:class I fructose-bisphosphate aldolase
MQRVFNQLESANGIMVAPGSVRKVEQCFIGRGKPSLVVHMDWKSFGRPWLTPGEGSRTEGQVAAITTVEDVVAAGADAIMSYLYVGQTDSALERMEIERNARHAAECARLGVVLIIEPRAARDYADPAFVSDEKLLASYCRIAAEIGADIVKCIWPGSGEKYEYIASACTAPMLLAGGPQGNDPRQTLELAVAAMEAGGSGLMFGRRITGSASPQAMIQALRAIVHDGADIESAENQYRELSRLHV